jgi:hypothetical protein
MPIAQGLKVMVARKLTEDQGDFGIVSRHGCSRSYKECDVYQFPVSKISVSINRSVISNQDALSRAAIRRAAKPVQDLFVSLTGGLGQYGVRATAASFDGGRQQPGSDDPRFVATTLAAKSADVLSQTASSDSGGFARQRFSPYSYLKSLYPLCTGSRGCLFGAELFSFNQGG